MVEFIILQHVGLSAKTNIMVHTKADTASCISTSLRVSQISESVRAFVTSRLSRIEPCHRKGSCVTMLKNQLILHSFKRGNNAPHRITKLFLGDGRNIDTVDEDLPGDEVLVDASEQRKYSR